MVNLTAVDVKGMIKIMFIQPAHIPVFTSCIRSKSTVVDCRVLHCCLVTNDHTQTWQSPRVFFDYNDLVNFVVILTCQAAWSRSIRIIQQHKCLIWIRLAQWCLNMEWGEGAQAERESALTYALTWAPGEF